MYGAGNNGNTKFSFKNNDEIEGKIANFHLEEGGYFPGTIYCVVKPQEAIR